MKKSLLVTAVTGALLAGTTGAGPALAAGPVAVECGATVTADAYLDRDLVWTGPVGITIVGSATLDLRGHTLRGPGADVDATGVLFDTSTSPVAVRNGTVAGWSTGIASDMSAGPAPAPSIVDRVVLRDNGTGLRGFQQDYAVTASRFQDNRVGVDGLYAALSLSSTRFTGNHVALSVATSPTVVKDSQFTANGTALECSESRLEVSRSTFRRNDTGISHWWCSGAKVSGSAFDSNGLAFRGGALSIPDELTGNVFTRNTTAVETYASIALTSNRFQRNGVGVRVPTSEEGTAVSMERNVFDSNGDAVHLETPATLKDNVAARNTGIGIYAPLATDLGGNVAYGNGVEPQCVGVSCTTRR